MPTTSGMEHDSDSGWVTFYRTWHKELGAYVLTQKKDGSTRTLREGRREVGLVDQLFVAQRRPVHTHHDLEALQAA